MITWGDSGSDIASRQAVLFDFDGTLADTKRAIVEIATDVLLDFGLSQDEVTVHVDDIIGPPFPQAFSLAFGLSEADADEVTRRYRARYYTLGLEAWPFFAGIADLLGALKTQGRRIAAASSKRQNMLERGIDDNGARALFDVVMGKIDGVSDTKADVVAAALERLGASSDEAVMVGDRHFDVKGAAEHGVPCVGVLFGHTATREELVAAGASAVVDTVEELGYVLLGAHHSI